MKKVVLILFAFTSLVAFGQADSGFTNKAGAKNLIVNGLKEGKWLEYLDGNERIMADTTPTPPFSYYCYDRLSIYKAGIPVGIVREYFKEGKLYVEIPYQNGVINGVKIQYPSRNDIFRYEIPYTNGKINGVEKLYFENGQLHEAVPFTDGEINGLCKLYFTNGVLIEEDSCSHSQSNGIKKGIMRVVENYGLKLLILMVKKMESRKCITKMES
jgi:hypothetical protein